MAERGIPPRTETCPALSRRPATMEFSLIPSDALERKEVRDALAKALASLKPIYREVFVLRDVQDLSITETAQLLGIEESSVKTRLLRARLQMRDALAPGLGGAWSMGGDPRKAKRIS